MSQSFACPHCRKVLRLAQTVPAGTMVKCPKCATLIRVGGNQAVTPSAPSSTPQPSAVAAIAPEVTPPAPRSLGQRLATDRRLACAFGIGVVLLVATAWLGVSMLAQRGTQVPVPDAPVADATVAADTQTTPEQPIAATPPRQPAPKPAEVAQVKQPVEQAQRPKTPVKPEAGKNPDLPATDVETQLRQRDALWKECERLSKVWQYKDAIDAGEKALAIEIKVLGAKHVDSIAKLQQLAHLHTEAGNFPDAEKLRRVVLARQTERFGEQAWQVTDARLDVVDVQALAKMSDKQRAELHQADVIIAQAFRGITASTVKPPPERWRESAEIAETVVVIRRRILGDHRKTGLVAAETSWLWQQGGEFAKARPFGEETLRIHRKVLGDNHPTTAAMFAALGDVCETLKDWPGVAENWKQALSIRVKVLGPNAPESKASLDRAIQLAWVVHAAERRAETQALGEHVLGLCVLAFGEDRQETTAILSLLAFNASTQSDWATARRHFVRAHAIRKRTLGEEHLLTLEALLNVGIFSVHCGDGEFGQTCYAKVIASRGRALPKDHALIGRALSELGLYKSRAADKTAARDLLEQAIEILRKYTTTKGERDTLANALGRLGNVQWRRGERKAARIAMAESIEVSRKGG